ncbi:hypothetical protein BUALT_Bualt01G0061100 [Buddleja alternifolia]|uniref:Transposase n=1 Tax=Buddleja alternifolia TaxID=168488 RepID=A0AAV6Y5W7_9LAMI|nr:hypothetical protein BUALT_Bualt01G0061100 [Buddleja alternifolia]
MHDLVSFNDETCIDNLRMSRNAFGRLCYILANVGGLENTKNVTVSYTISKHFNSVLSALLKLHNLFLVKPTPIEDDTTNERWKWFKGCLGALDGTYIPLQVAQKDKTRYRNRKGDVSVNVLAVCDINMNYVYMLCGWEGSAADSRVLRDAITKENDFRVPDGNYYLCDSGYTNGDGFLAPYRGVRYHIQEWNSHRTPPQNAHELFNKIHARARNVIERIEMSVDPLEAEFPEVDDEISDDHNSTFSDQVEPSQHWTNWRERLQWLQMLLEQAMVQAFPGTNIRADPHINSKITVWRKNYATISTLQSRSGFGWNDATNMITVESEDAWNNFVKVDNFFEFKLNNSQFPYAHFDFNARNMRYKTWPLYKDWVEIFGKDRATGEGAEGFADVVEEQVHRPHVNLADKENELGGDYVPFYSNPQADECQSMSFSNANDGGSSKSSNKRKRKVVDENDDRFIDLMTSFCDKTNERLGDISRRIGFEHDASLSRKAVYETLGDLGSSLNMEGMILVSHLIVNNTKNMDLFFSLPKDGRKTMVHMILEGKFAGIGGY